MIEFEITESQERNKIGTYIYSLDTIQFGSHVSNDCFLPNDEIQKSHLSLVIEENKLIIIPDPELEFYHVNGKKTKGRKILRPNDIVKMGSAIFQIKSFSPEIPFPKNEFLNNRVDQLQKENSPLLNVLQNMETP